MVLKRILATILSVGILSVDCFSLEAQDTVRLDLDACLSIALSSNPTIKISDMEIERVDYSKKEAIGGLLPNVSFGATYNRMLQKQVMYMNMDGFGGSSGGGGEADEKASRASSSRQGIKMGLDNSYSLGFQASVPLIAPQLWASLKLNDSQILESVEASRSSKISMVNEVKSAYYRLMLAEASRRVIQESYDMAAFTHEIYSKKYEAGAASDYEVLRTSVAMKNIEPELLQADIAIKQARLNLLILMGLNADFPLEISGTLSDYEKTMYEDAMSLSRDYAGNTELRQNELRIATLRQALKVQKMAWYPTLSASINYNWTSNSNGSPFRNFQWNPYSVFGLTLNVPIFQGGSRYIRQKQAQIQVDEMMMQRENLQRSVQSQVDLAIDNITLNVKQIASSSESVKEAERAHDIMDKSFKIGAASYLDLRDSELALTQSRLSYYQSIYNYLIANATLEQLLGNADIEKYEKINNGL